jgi:hypothetical protein
MNLRRYQIRPSSLPHVAIFLGAFVAAAGGIYHVHQKNQQIQTAREIDAIERRIGQYHLDISITKMRMDEQLNRFAIRKQLEENASALRPIPPGLAEEINPSATPERDVATLVP